MLDALQNKSAEFKKIDDGEIVITFLRKDSRFITCIVSESKRKVIFKWLHTENEQYIKESELMAMIYYINEYGE